jgi:hypothetical protein
MMATFTMHLDTSKMDAFLASMGKRLPEAMDLVLKSVGFETQNRITKKTPVDTGRARAGWQGEHDRQDQHKATFTISNNVPYIIFLEYGHSKQAPSGMVRITMQELHGKLFLSRAAAVAIEAAAHKSGAR